MLMLNKKKQEDCVSKCFLLISVDGVSKVEDWLEKQIQTSTSAEASSTVLVNEFFRFNF